MDERVVEHCRERLEEDDDLRELFEKIVRAALKISPRFKRALKQTGIWDDDD